MSGKANLVVALIFLSIYTAAGMQQVRGNRGNPDIGQLFRNKLDAKKNLVKASVALGAGLASPVIKIKQSIVRPIFSFKRNLIRTKKNLLTSLLRPVAGLKADGLVAFRNILDKKINFLRGF